MATPPVLRVTVLSVTDVASLDLWDAVRAAMLLAAAAEDGTADGTTDGTTDGTADGTAKAAAGAPPQIEFTFEDVSLGPLSDAPNAACASKWHAQRSRTLREALRSTKRAPHAIVLVPPPPSTPHASPADAMSLGWALALGGKACKNVLVLDGEGSGGWGQAAVSWGLAVNPSTCRLVRFGASALALALQDLAAPPPPPTAASKRKKASSSEASTEEPAVEPYTVADDTVTESTDDDKEQEEVETASTATRVQGTDTGKGKGKRPRADAAMLPPAVRASSAKKRKLTA